MGPQKVTIAKRFQNHENEPLTKPSGGYKFHKCFTLDYTSVSNTRQNMQLIGQKKSTHTQQRPWPCKFSNHSCMTNRTKLITHAPGWKVTKNRKTIGVHLVTNHSHNHNTSLNLQTSCPEKGKAQARNQNTWNKGVHLDLLKITSQIYL